MRRATSTCLLFVGLSVPFGVAACNSDGRTLRPAGPDQTASVYTTTTTTTAIAPDLDDIAPTNIDATTVLPSVSTNIEDPALDATDLAFVLNVPWEDGGIIDPRYTCDGADIQPGFSWLGTPADAVEMALVVIDIDADNFVHWVIAGLDPTNPFVEENSTPVSAIEDDEGWRGPCPPTGTTHHYRFTLYALAEHIELPSGSTAADL
ncbi:MAG: YbhB/YbcL family Raf kinase inhibitor-like protein, partial [Ilumatobacteraceae bacterium]